MHNHSLWDCNSHRKPRIANANTQAFNINSADKVLRRCPPQRAALRRIPIWLAACTAQCCNNFVFHATVTPESRAHHVATVCRARPVVRLRRPSLHVRRAPPSGTEHMGPIASASGTAFAGVKSSFLLGPSSHNEAAGGGLRITAHLGTQGGLSPNPPAAADMTGQHGGGQRDAVLVRVLAVCETEQPAAPLLPIT